MAYVTPKDVKSTLIKINGSDISALVDKIEIYQDVFLPFWTSTLIIRDTQNIITNLPVVVGDKVSIIIDTGAPVPCSGKSKFTFIIYEVGDRELIKEQDYVYRLSLISPKFFTDQKTRISKSYKGGTATELVKKITSEYLGTIERSSDTTQAYNVIIPNLSPVAAIGWVSSFAESQGGADLLFYQCNINNEFAFESMESMFNNDSGLVLKQKNQNSREASHKENDDSFINIEQHQFISHINAIPNLHSGFYGSTTMSFDIVNKTFNKSEYTYAQDLELDNKYKPFNNDIFSDTAQSNISFIPVHNNITNGKTPNDNHINWMGSRQSNIMKLETNRLLVDIPGHACLNDYLGKMINIDLPSHQDINPDEKYDKYLKGKWLITAMRHIISGTEYHIFLECNKKRMNKEYDI